ncbi:MAG TPA: NADH-quinone oxidoreductase subunit J [Gemmataceae bacterium]
MNWLTFLVAGLGFAAVFLLLPRPRAYPAALGGLLGLAALAALGAFLGYAFPGGVALSAESLLFYTFALLAVLFGGVMITQRNPARAAIAFAVVVLSVCGLFLLQAAPFLMAATLIVYAGAIIVTFLFVIMLSRQAGPTDADDRSREPLFAPAVGFFLLGTLLVVIQRAYDRTPLEDLVRRAEAIAAAGSVAELRGHLADEEAVNAYLREWDQELRRSREHAGAYRGPAREALAGADERLRTALDGAAVEWNNLAMALDAGPDAHPGEVERALEQARAQFRELAAGGTRLHELRSRPEHLAADLTLSGYGRAAAPGGEGRAADLPARNVAAVGRTLFSDHLIAIEMAGTLLLIATIGAVVIAGGRRGAAA